MHPCLPGAPQSTGERDVTWGEWRTEERSPAAHCDFKFPSGLCGQDRGTERMMVRTQLVWPDRPRVQTRRFHSVASGTRGPLFVTSRTSSSPLTCGRRQRRSNAIDAFCTVVAQSKCLINVTCRYNHIKGSEKSCRKKTCPTVAPPSSLQSHQGTREESSFHRIHLPSIQTVSLEG